MSAELHYTLPATLTIDTVEAVAGELRALALAEGSVLTLDASGTDLITTPGVQLLLAAAKSAAQAGGQLRLTPGDATRAAFEGLGLTTYLNEWSAPHA